MLENPWRPRKVFSIGIMVESLQATMVNAKKCISLESLKTSFQHHHNSEQKGKHTSKCKKDIINGLI